MRILYQHRTQADGAEGVHIAEMIGAFRALGHDVRLAGAVPGDTRPVAGGRLKAWLPEGLFEGVAAAYNVAEYAQVRRAIGAFQPDLVYVRHARFGAAAVLAARHAGVPAVLEVNCLFADEEYHQFEPLACRRLARVLERRALRTASHVVAVSTPLAGRVQRLGVARVRLLPNGADTVRFDPARVDGRAIRQRYVAEGTCLVGWAGILRAWHGLDLLLDAIARVDGVHLLLVGDGPARVDVEARAAALGLADRVHITGRVAHEAMPEHIAAMDIAVVAHDRTGVASPMKLLEYLSMARAVVVPDLPNIRDVVRPEVDASLFTAGDVAALAAAIARLAADPVARERLGQEARRQVLSERTWLANARAITALITSG